MAEFDNEGGPEEQEQAERIPVFETVRRNAIAELGQLHTLSFEEALVKMRKIAEEKGITNPILVVAIQEIGGQEYVLNQETAEAQWETLVGYYEDDEELAMPVAFVTEGD